MPLWHGGDGRSSHANPLFPMYNAPVRTPSGDGQGRRVSASARARVVPGDGQAVRRTSGDGQSGRPQDVVLNVNPVSVNPLSPPARKGFFEAFSFGRSKDSAPRGKGSRAGTDRVTSVGPTDETGTRRTDTWKLVAIVFVFFIWIGTASTLLFLYMDQYLFP